MINNKKALVCIDLSDYSEMTAEYAFSLTSDIVSQFVVLNVINNRDVEAVRSASHFYPSEFDVEDFIKKTRTERQHQISEMIQQYSPPESSQISIRIREGNPFKEIMSAIQEENIDLVIIGNKGRSDIIGTLMGSIAEKVLRHSPVTVMSVRDRAQLHRRTEI